MLPEAAGRGQNFQARGQSFSLWTDPKPENNIFIFFPCCTNGFQVGLFTQLCHRIGFPRRLQTIRKKNPKQQRANERVFTRQRKMY